ncbi:hypothetical protein [Spiroplasma endosymbiont of Atherix ibis]|uniref:hypothetical protein n=1 Tax=Spiroplasma endosymbiont of Atherix ibis TaxID=3066291 RepID=UPI0030CAC9DD
MYSDNRNKYTSENYISLCIVLQIIRSYSKPGAPHHNGKHKSFYSFYSCLKDENIRTYLRFKTSINVWKLHEQD